MKLRLLFLLSLILLFTSTAYSQNTQWFSRPVEVRAVWMDRRSIPKTEEGIRELVRSYARAGINMLHPEVIYNGYSAYPSAYLTQQDLWPGVDMLGVLIDEAHQNGMEVHPWVWVFRTGNTNDKGGILAAHPEWVAVAEDGSTASSNGSYWLCPSIPDLRRLLINAFAELAQKYPVDGIELDYVRFESPNYCYNQSCRDQFEVKYGVDPLAIEPFTKKVLDWYMWREDLVDSFVAEVSTQLKHLRPDLQISAAVASFPDQARTSYLQNWAHWADNKWVEFISPMDYTTDPANFMRRVSSTTERIDSRALIIPGLGLHLVKDLDPMLYEVKIARGMPTEGVALFASAYLDPARLQAFGEGPFRKKADLPTRKPVEGARKLMASARDKLKNNPSQVAVDEASVELASALNLVEYASYRMKDTGYVPPTPTPIFLPETVEPIPSVTIPSGETPTIDGKPQDTIWQNASRVDITKTNLGQAAPHESEVLLAHDNSNLYIAVIAHEPSQTRPKPKVTEENGPVFYDDSVEVFLAPGKDPTPYYHFAVNTAGVKYMSKGKEGAAKGTWQAAASKEPGSWTVEIAIPLATLGTETPAAGGIFRANFCRNRIGETPETTCWSPTYGPYHTPVRFGEIVF